MLSYPENKRKSRTLILLLLLVLWHSAAFAAPKNVSVKPEPTWIRKLPARTQTTISPDDVNGGFHYLQMDLQFEVAQQERYFHYVYKLTTEEGVQNLSELNITFDPNHEQLQLHKVVVWRNGKPINQLNLNKVKVLQREKGMEQGIYDESLTAVLVLEDIRVGDVVEYAASVKGGNPVFGGKFFNSFNLQGYDPIDEMLVHMVAPQHRKINYKLYLTDKKPTVATANGSTSYTWHLKDLPATPVDDETPSWFDPYPGVYMSEYNTWEEVAQWALPLYEGQEKLSKALQAKVDSIKSTHGSDEGRLEAALRFVQDEVRYLGFESGVNGFKPHSPSVVFAQRFGDCKDKALLLCTMLRQMNIKAYPALVNSSSGAHIQDQLPSPYAFNHCIVRVELLGNQVFWYDATISKQRGNYKSIYLPNYGKALVIAPHTKDLATVVPPATDRPHISTKELYYIDDFDGPVTLEVRTTYTGVEADNQRSYFATTSLKDIGKAYLNFYASQYPDVEQAEAPTYEDVETSNSFTIFEKYTISNFWTPQEENGKVVEAWFSPQVLRSYIREPKTSKRTMPLALSHPLYVEQKITVLLPESWTVDGEENEIEDDAFFFRRTAGYSSGGKELILHYTYQSHQDYVEAGATAAYLRNQKALLDELSYGLTYNKAFASGNDTDFSWQVLLLVVVLLVGFSLAAYKLYFWDPVPANGYSLADAESIGGWLVLPLLGLFFTPVRVLNFLISNEYFNQIVWTELLDASSNVYSPALVVTSMAELVVNVGFLVFSILLICLFLKRRSSVPRLMVMFYAANFGYILLDYLLVQALNLPMGSTAETVRSITTALVGAAIWIPYFNVSQRVKETFVEQLQPYVAEEAPQYEADERAMIK